MKCFIHILPPVSCCPINTWSSMKQTHEADWGARPNSQCVDYCYFSSLPHKMVHARKTHTFIRQLRNCPFAERRGNMESWKHGITLQESKGSREKVREASRLDLEIRLQEDKLQPSHQLTAAITSQWLCLCFLYLLKSVSPGAQCLPIHTGSQAVAHQTQAELHWSSM